MQEFENSLALLAAARATTPVHASASACVLKNYYEFRCSYYGTDRFTSFERNGILNFHANTRRRSHKVYVLITRINRRNRR